MTEGSSAARALPRAVACGPYASLVAARALLYWSLSKLYMLADSHDAHDVVAYMSEGHALCTVSQMGGVATVMARTSLRRVALLHLRFVLLYVLAAGKIDEAPSDAGSCVASHESMEVGSQASKWATAHGLFTTEQVRERS